MIMNAMPVLQFQKCSHISNGHLVSFMHSRIRIDAVFVECLDQEHLFSCLFNWFRFCIKYVFQQVRMIHRSSILQALFNISSKDNVRLKFFNV